MELFSTSIRITVCSLAVALSLLTLVTVTRGNSNNIHPQPYQHHQPILSGALFPTERTEAKQPCPRECIQHKSGLYLAVTSIGYGFPRVQFTCTGPHHPQATAHEGGGGGGGGEKTSLPCSPQQVHNPADPTPTPLPSHRHDQQVRAHDDIESDEKSTSYTDLHITAGSHSRQQHDSIQKELDPSEHERQHPTTAIDYEGLGFTGDAAKYQPHYGFVFSPRERAWEPSEVHTTTFTFGMGHPYGYRQDAQQHQQQIEMQAPSITPEAVVSFPAPTPMADKRHRSHQERVHEPELEKDGENTAGPPLPTPESLAGQSVTGVERTRSVERKHPSIPAEDKREREPKKIKKVVHRVTTLIIETETIIAPPHPTHATRGVKVDKKQVHEQQKQQKQKQKQQRRLHRH